MNSDTTIAVVELRRPVLPDSMSGVGASSTRVEEPTTAEPGATPVSMEVSDGMETRLRSLACDVIMGPELPLDALATDGVGISVDTAFERSVPISIKKVHDVGGKRGRETACAA